MSTRVSKSGVANKTREIRRVAKAVDGIVHALNAVAQRNGEAIPQTLERHPNAAQELSELLYVIDGTSAQIREMLLGEDY